MKLKDRVAIITGGGRNIGKAIAYRLHELGCQVVVCARTQKEIDHVAGVIQEQGGRSAAICCDVGKEDQVQRAVDATVKVFGRVDFLVNNAGNYIEKPLGETSVEDFDDAVSGNLRGAFLFSKAVVPELRKNQSGGRIVNVSSLLAQIPARDVSIYCAVKAGLIGFSKALARELHSDGINVNAVCPGMVTTGEQAIELEETRWKLGEQLLPRDVADVVAYLLTDESSQITGAAIQIPGSTGIRVGALARG
ncbi:MAG: SDR family oxidoreductase [Planctomycetes bacterium]|nr:SDR family oxidoreductase [Planctomycetota bacterium]